MSSIASSSNQAGPSRRTPVRTLRQPALLNVATRDGTGELQPQKQNDTDSFRSAMDKKVDWRRRGERWMDKMCEGTLGNEEVKRGVSGIS